MNRDHLSELKKLQDSYESQNQRLTEQVEQLSIANNELETTLKSELVDAKKQVQDLTQELAENNRHLEEPQEGIEKADTSRAELIEEVEQKHRLKISELESEFEQRLNEQKNEMAEAAREAETNLQQMKSLFEIDKESLLARIQEEKERAER